MLPVQSLRRSPTSGARAVHSRKTVYIQPRLLRIPIDFAVTGIVKPSVIVLNETGEDGYSVKFDDRRAATPFYSCKSPPRSLGL